MDLVVLWIWCICRFSVFVDSVLLRHYGMLLRHYGMLLRHYGMLLWRHYGMWCEMGRISRFSVVATLRNVVATLRNVVATLRNVVATLRNGV